MQIDFTLPPAHPVRKFDSIMFMISKNKDLDTRLYLSAYWHKNCFMGGHRQIFSGKRYNTFLFDVKHKVDLNINQEAILLKSRKTAKETDKERRRHNKKQILFAPFVLKVKAEITNSRKMFFNPRKKPDTKGLSHKDAVKVLTSHRNIMVEKYLARFATLDDLFLAQSYLTEINKRNGQSKALKKLKDIKHKQIKESNSSQSPSP